MESTLAWGKYYLSILWVLRLKSISNSYAIHNATFDKTCLHLFLGL
jgi:hypothetical protein